MQVETREAGRHRGDAGRHRGDAGRHLGDADRHRGDAGRHQGRRQTPRGHRQHGDTDSAGTQRGDAVDTGDAGRQDPEAESRPAGPGRNWHT